MTAQLQPVELVGVYDAEEIYHEFANKLIQSIEDTYTFVGSAILTSYAYGIEQVAAKYQIDPEDIPLNEQVIEVQRQATVELIATHNFEALQTMLDIRTVAIRENWDETTLRDRLQQEIISYGHKLDRVVRTEVNRAGNQGRLDAMSYVGIAYGKIYTAEDDRVCETQFDVVLLGPVNGCKEFWTGKHKMSVFRLETISDMLPFHPICRCVAKPIGKPQFT